MSSRTAIGRLLLPCLIAWITGAVYAMAAPYQTVGGEFARLNTGGGTGTSSDYSVESAVNVPPSGPGFQQHGMYDQVPLLWFENASIQPYIDLIAPSDAASVTGGAAIPVTWATTTARAGSSVQLELWQHNSMKFVLGRDSNESGQDTFSASVVGVPTGSDYVLRLRSLSDPSMWDDSTVTITTVTSNAVSSSNWAIYQ